MNQNNEGKQKAQGKQTARKLLMVKAARTCRGLCEKFAAARTARDDAECVQAELQVEIEHIKKDLKPTDEVGVKTLEFKKLQLDCCPGAIASEERSIAELEAVLDGERPAIENALWAILSKARDAVLRLAISTFLPFYASPEATRAVAERCPAVTAFARRCQGYTYADREPFLQLALAVFDEYEKRGTVVPEEFVAKK